MAPSHTKPARARKAERALAPKATIDGATADLEADIASKICVPPSWICEDTLLPNLAKQHLERFTKLLPARRLACDWELTWATACSGSDGVHFVFDVLEALYREAGYTATFTQCFSCEANPEKQKWIDMLINNGTQGPAATCIFKNICELGNEVAECVVHHRSCTVPNVDIMIVGTSCKDMSSLSTGGRAAGGLVFELQWSPGGSAQTFHGFLAYVQSHRPSMVIFENVDKLADDAQPTAANSRDEAGPNRSNLDILMAEMAGRGFEGQRFLVDAKSFGVPCRRRRVYCVFVRVVQCQVFRFNERPVTSVFRTLCRLMAACQRTPPSLVDCVLEDHDPAVEGELARRIQAGLGKQIPSASHAWTQQLMKEFQAAGLRYGVHSADDRSRNSPWFGTLSQRERGALAYSQAMAPSKVCRNVAMSVNRVATSHQETTASGQVLHISPALLPTHQLWVDAPAMGSPRLLLGREALRLQGFPVGLRPDLLGAFSESLMTDLAGNMMTLTIVLALVMSSVAALPWDADGASAGAQPSSEHEVEDVLQMLASLPAVAVAATGNSENDERGDRKRRCVG